MTAKQAAAAARAKKIEAETLERMGSTYRQFAAACRSERVVGNYYELEDISRERYQREAKAAAKALGLRNEKTEQSKG
jgi:hypothetical protein